MSLTSSMWTGVSGLLQHGDKMNVVGNNIANVNTVGFKGQRMDFADFLYANSYGSSGVEQVGLGVTTSAIIGNFSQGAFESTTNATDLAISGSGFFQVSPVGSEEEFYTRAGNFNFTKEGYLVDPNGYVLQGWKIDNNEAPSVGSTGSMPAVETSGFQGTGVPTDIRLDTWTVPPKQTTNVGFVTNLSADSIDEGLYADNPFASLVNAWDGTQPPPNNQPEIPESAFSYQTSIDVYDEAGVTHTLTIYYDKVDPSTYDGDGEENLWEYMVTMDPAEDKRMFFDESLNGGAGGFIDANDTKLGGLLMSGTMTFNSAGQLINQTAYTIGGSIEPNQDAAGTPIEGGNYKADPETGALIPVVQDTSTTEGILNSLYPATVSQAGFPTFVANFTGIAGANSTGAVEGEDYLIELDLGLRVSSFSNPWSTSPTQSLGEATLTSGVDNLYNADYNPDGSEGPEYMMPNPLYISGYSVGDPIPNPLTVKGLPDNVVYPAGAASATVTLPNGMTVNYTPTNVNDPLAGGTIDTTGIDANVFTWQGLTANPADMTTAYTGTATQNQLLIEGELPKQDMLADIVPPVVRQEYTSTSYAGSNSTKEQSQNGYGHGDLNNYYVDGTGVVTGVYSNGVTLPLYQVVLFDFTAEQGLMREGGNLYSQTLESGEPQSGVPGEAGMGTIHSNSLEMSNVDLSTEFVLMITTQRGFQANSKLITTTDTMLDTVINMKR